MPREKNELADYLSRVIGYDDWSINTEVFSCLDSSRGSHSVDRFANSCNKQVDRYNSLKGLKMDT